MQVSRRNFRSCETTRQRAAELLEKPFQQDLRPQVEEIRRLVQEEQIGIVQEQRRELDPRLPAAGKLADPPREQRRLEFELPRDLAAPPIRLARIAHQELEHRLVRAEGIVLPQISQPQPRMFE